MRKTILTFTGLIIGILSLIANVSVALAAPGDVMWTQASNPSAYGDWANAVAVDGSGVYIVGEDEYPGSGNARWRIEKRSLTTGSLIWSQASNPSAYDDWAWGVAVDGSGVYIVGEDEYPGFGNARWRIENRSLTTGSLIWSQASNPSAYNDKAKAVAVDGSGVYIVGHDQYPGSGNNRWRMEKRSLPDGSSIWIQSRNPSAYKDTARSVAVDGSGGFIVGEDEYPGSGNARWRMEKRNLSTGSNLWTRTSNPSAYEDDAWGVATDGTGVYIVGSDSYPGLYNERRRIDKRAP